MAPVVTVTLGENYVEAQCVGLLHNKEGIEQRAIQSVAYDVDAGVFTMRTDAFDHTWMRGTKATFVLKGAL